MFLVFLWNCFGFFQNFNFPNPEIYQKNFWNYSVLVLPAENKNYIWKKEFSLPDAEISGIIIFCEQFSQIFEIPEHLVKFIWKSSQICTQPPSVHRVDALYFLRNSHDEIIKNADEIDENTKFSLVVRTNFGKNFSNNQDENVYENFDDSHALEDDFWGSWIFLSEEIKWKCEPYKCEVDAEKLPILMKKFLQNEENNFWFVKDFGLENLIFQDGKMIIEFEKSQKLSENFLFFAPK